MLPRSRLLTVIVTPGSAPPDESLTTPAIAPSTLWPRARTSNTASMRLLCVSDVQPFVLIADEDVVLLRLAVALDNDRGERCVWRLARQPGQLRAQLLLVERDRLTG